MYDDEMTLGQWIGTILLSCIPCVNIILLIIWAAGSGNATRKKWAQAMLIVTAIMMVVGFMVGIIFGAALVATLPAVYGTPGIM